MSQPTPASESERLSNIINRNFGVPNKYWATLVWISPADVREMLLAQKVAASRAASKK
jgi:hypothetical protein